MLHCALIEPVKSLKPTVGQIYKYVGLEEKIRKLLSYIPSLTATLDASNYQETTTPFGSTLRQL